MIDATNLIARDTRGIQLLAEYVKSLTGDPWPRRVTRTLRRCMTSSGGARKANTLYAADEEAREVMERLIQDAGYEP